MSPLAIMKNLVRELAGKGVKRISYPCKAGPIEIEFEPTLQPYTFEPETTEAKAESEKRRMLFMSS